MSVVLAECRESIGQVAVKYHRVSADMRVDQELADMSTDSRSTYQPTVGPHISLECQPTEAFITHDPFSGKIIHYYGINTLIIQLSYL